jgi:hypothetical protein
MFSEQFAMALPEVAAARLRAVVARTQAFLLEALQEAQKGGTIRTDLPPKALLTVVFGLLMHLVYTRAAGHGRVDDASETCATLLAILQPPPAG